jgi:serine/threonine-protein kinase
VVTSKANVANIAERTLDGERAIALRRDVLAARVQLAGSDDPKSIDALYALAAALHGAGKTTEAKPLFDEWLARFTSRPREVSAWHADQLTAGAKLLQYSDESGRAESMFGEALEIRRALYGERHHRVAASLQDLGLLLSDRQRTEEAEPMLREAAEILRAAYPTDHPELAAALRRHGFVLYRLQRFAEALEPLREALAMRRRLQGPEDIAVAAVELDLASSLLWTGGYEEAESMSRDAVRIYRAELGADNSMVFFAQAHLADALRGLGRYREAEPLLLAAYRRFDPPNSITARWRRYTLAALARLHEAEGRPAEAARYRQLLEATDSAATSAGPGS